MQAVNGKSARKIIITGGVAVGKTSVMTAVKKYLNEKAIKFLEVPEYIDGKEDGLEMLNKYLSKTIPSFEFQSYIMNYYDWYFTNKVTNEDNLLLFERTLDDSVICFSNLDNHKHELSDEEFMNIYKQAISINTKYNIPSYISNDNFEFIPIKTTNSDLAGKMIAAIIEVRPDANIVFGLHNDDDVCYERMLLRNRPGETEVYTPQYIASFNKIYRNIYSKLSSNGNIEFTDMGIFLN